MATYLPPRLGEFDAWEENFLSKIGPIALALGYSNEEVAEVIQLITDHRAAYSEMNSQRQKAIAATSRHDDLKSRTVSRVTQFVANIKSNKGYRDEMGKDLGIVVSGANGDYGVVDMQPQLEAIRDGGKIVVKFKKKDMDGIRLYCRRGDETEYTYLGDDTSPPYYDGRPNLKPGVPEKREYYAFFLRKDEIVGQQSPVVSIVVA